METQKGLKHQENYRSKEWRKQKSNQKYIKRLKKLAVHWYIDRYTRATNWRQLYNAKGTLCYKTTSTPCSCILCRGKRYNRLEYKSVE